LARSAAKRATSAQRTQFRAIAAGMDNAAGQEDDIAFMRLDREFNLLVLDAAGNEFAAAAMSLMNGLSRRFWYMHYKQAADLPLAARLHAAIARAIGDGDEAAAGHGSDALVDYIQAFARATIG
jgi:DNA-binding GntR family transcriptional regulator